MIENKKEDGMAIASMLYADYGSRARELKREGKRIIGYLSALTPVEIMTAAGVVPFRLKGDTKEAITKADSFMEAIVCPFVRSVFDSVLSGKYNFLDGIVLPHQCDSIEKTNDVWRYNLNLPFWHFLNIPHIADRPSLILMGRILREFIESLEKFTGSSITNDDLTRAIRLHNENRQLMRDLYRLRQSSPPLISGVEVMKILVAVMGLPVEESNDLIRVISREVKKRESPIQTGGPRIMLVGDQLDDTTLVDIIEEAGASVVMDDLSIGGKVYLNDVDLPFDSEASNPIEAIGERYLKKLKLPTTFIGTGDNYEENLEARFGHLREYADVFSVDGIILLTYKNCDPYGFEVPALTSYLESSKRAVFHIEDEYHSIAYARVKTRIEAFIEMIA